jgi:Nuclease-related domain
MLASFYFLLNDVVLPGHPGNIDHVVIGPCGVVVIETKNHPRHVQNRAAIAVREALARVHPELGDSVLRSVDSVAVFTNPSSRVSVDRAQTTIGGRRASREESARGPARRRGARARHQGPGHPGLPRLNRSAHTPSITSAHSSSISGWPYRMVTPRFV